MKILKGQLGMTLIEMSVTLAISGVIMGPLAGVMAIQIRAPVKVVSEIATKRQLQKASLVITEDASAAETFEVAAGAPEYGTFDWLELSQGGNPIVVSVRYFFEVSVDRQSGEPTGALFRDVIRGGRQEPPKVWLEGIDKFEDVGFEYTPAAWVYNPDFKTWAFTEGKILVTVTQTIEAGAEFEATVTTEKIVAHFRPDIDRPVAQPKPVSGG